MWNFCLLTDPAPQENTKLPIKTKSLVLDSRACKSSVPEQNGVDEAHEESEAEQIDAREEIQSVSVNTSQAQSSSNHKGILILQLFKFFNLLSQKQYPVEKENQVSTYEQ